LYGSSFLQATNFKTSFAEYISLRFTKAVALGKTFTERTPVI